MLIDALGEAREHLILNKYNDAMMLMAQITIDVIEHLIDESLIVSKGYEEDLKTLKAERIISEDTAHNFETLIISGVQAHNGVDIPKEHATKALEVLTNELDVLLKKENDIPKASENIEGKARFNSTNQEKSQVFEYEEEDEKPYPGDFSKDMTMNGEPPVFLNVSSDDMDFRKKERMREAMLANQGKRVIRNPIKLFAIIVPIILLLLLVFLLKSCFSGGKENAKRVVVEPTDIVETIETETIETMPTEPPIPPEAGYYDVTGDLVKIRDKATTDGSKVKGTVNKGDKVQVKEFYNADWAVVVYEGEDAFISRRYIKKDESLSPVFEEGQVP